ncbi:hypothetical protein SAMN05421848_0318 [Kushneria avicenniae]|uniref:DUF2062 domain-containing protein n=1 Tax=Kushneria avicenniae TaxID=402385 RepID=A0A1I1FX49_9GAMM|nr:DUF2062 domain-containing protein [Kushneria avicenniae]SFC04037.1 hypothetical protein SAMN05421848_0318 [Kushneria avicenniae]
MLRQLIQRYLPDPEAIRRQKSLRLIHPLLGNPALWLVTRRSIANGMSVGLFCALLPIPGQMLVAAIGAWWLRGHLPLALALVWLTNPLTMPVVFYVTYRAGAWILQTPPRALPDEVSVSWFANQLIDMMPSLIIGSLACALVIGIVANILTRLCWRWHILRVWRKRRQHRRPR